MKILILGNSNIFQRKIYFALKKFKKLNIEIASTQKINNKFKISKQYKDYDEAINNTKAKVVYISLINSIHYGFITEFTSLYNDSFSTALRIIQVCI